MMVRVPVVFNSNLCSIRKFMSLRMMDMVMRMPWIMDIHLLTIRQSMFLRLTRVLRVSELMMFAWMMVMNCVMVARFRFLALHK